LFRKIQNIFIYTLYLYTSCTAARPAEKYKIFKLFLEFQSKMTMPGKNVQRYIDKPLGELSDITEAKNYVQKHIGERVIYAAVRGNQSQEEYLGSCQVFNQRHPASFLMIVHPCFWPYLLVSVVGRWYPSLIN
jgi:hypothetical protein